MRCLVPALLALPAAGCVYVSTTPAETYVAEVLDQNGVSLPEAWALTWSDKRTCPFGLMVWLPMGGPGLWPDLRSLSDVRLRRLTPRDNLLTRPPEYEAYVNWGFLLLPPGTYCSSRSTTYFFAAGCPWGFDGARARDLSASSDGDHVRVDKIGPVLDLLRDDTEVPRQDLRDFATMLLKNFAQLGVREEAWPDVVRKLQVLTK